MLHMEWIIIVPLVAAVPALILAAQANRDLRKTVRGLNVLVATLRKRGVLSDEDISEMTSER